MESVCSADILASMALREGAKMVENKHQHKLVETNMPPAYNVFLLEMVHTYYVQLVLRIIRQWQSGRSHHVITTLEPGTHHSHGHGQYTKIVWDKPKQDNLYLIKGACSQYISTIKHKTKTHNAQKDTVGARNHSPSCFVRTECQPRGNVSQSEVPFLVSEISFRPT